MHITVSLTKIISLSKRRILHALRGETRSDNIIKNVILSGLTKGGSIVIGLALVPMTINYISPEQYGIWLTISSIITWMGFFDIGLGNGLRNKLTVAISTNKLLVAKRYVSTTYATLLMISTLLMLAFYLIHSYIPWGQFLNVSDPKNDLSYIIFVTFSSFCIQFVIQIINVILNATHQSSKVGLVYLISQILTLAALLVVRQTVSGSLRVMVWILAVTPVLTSFIFSVYFFKFIFKEITPSYRLVNFKYIKDIFNVGAYFFIIQIGALVLFQTNNLIITRIEGASGVTQFNIAYKLFSVLIMVFNIIMTPYWSAFTDAFVRNDFTWITNTIRKLRQIWFYSILIFVPITTLASPYIYKIWIGNSIDIPSSLSINMGLYVISYTALLFNCTFLNGIGKLKIQLLLYIIVTIINIPMSIFFCNKFGVTGVALSNVIVCTIMSVVVWTQTNKIIGRVANGIWNS